MQSISFIWNCNIIELIITYYNICLPSTVSSSFFFLYSLGLKSLLPTFILTSTFTNIYQHFIINSKINQALSIKIFTLPSPKEFPWSKEFSWSKEVTIGNNKMRMKFVYWPNIFNSGVSVIQYIVFKHTFLRAPLVRDTIYYYYYS